MQNWWTLDDGIEGFYNIQQVFFCKAALNKDKLPTAVIEANSDTMKLSSNAFGIENLNSLLVEKMYEYENDYVRENLVPTLFSNLGLEINGLEDDLSGWQRMPHSSKINWQYHEFTTE